MEKATNNYELIRVGHGVPPINIIYEDNHLLAAVKPAGIPAQQDRTKRPDLLNILKLYLKQKYNKPGNVWLSLLHRLDQPVGGVMLFAKTTKAASRLSEQIRRREWDKYYLAVVEGTVTGSGEWEDYLSERKVDGKISLHPEGKLCRLAYESIQILPEHNQTLLRIRLITGRRHQIRVQASSRNHPLIGDYLYGHGRASGAEAPALFAYKLEVDHPITKQRLTIEADPLYFLGKNYPFSNFKLVDLSAK